MKKFFYRVASGDTVIALSERFNIPPLIIISDNRLKKEISEGDMLVMEKPNRVYRVQASDTLKIIAERFGTPAERLLTINRTTYIFCSLLIAV